MCIVVYMYKNSYKHKFFLITGSFGSEFCNTLKRIMLPNMNRVSTNDWIRIIHTELQFLCIFSR